MSENDEDEMSENERKDAASKMLREKKTIFSNKLDFCFCFRPQHQSLDVSHDFPPKFTVQWIEKVWHGNWYFNQISHFQLFQIMFYTIRNFRTLDFLEQVLSVYRNKFRNARVCSSPCNRLSSNLSNPESFLVITREIKNWDQSFINVQSWGKS